jgi:branched-chain amino acid transport system permease protein
MRERDWVAVACMVILLVLPAVGSDFFVDFVMTRTLMLGLAASTLVFLSAYGGMVSLAQWLIFGAAGFAVGNMVAESGRGLRLGWSAWPSAVIALVVCTVLALVLGALAARTSGIYFLMLTLTFAVIGFFFFGQVTTFSGFGGMTGIDPPAFFDGHPKRVYYAALVLSILGYGAFRAIARSPFGIALQGVRDDPVRMASLGFDVALHRTLAFAVAGFVAAVAGVLNIWWNGQIDPTSISLGPTLDLLIIAVIGGVLHLEGAWLGAFIFITANLYLRDIPGLGSVGGFLGDRVLAEERFNTVVGLLLLAIVVGSPDGAAGLMLRVRRALGRLRPHPTSAADSTPDRIARLDGGRRDEAQDDSRQTTMTGPNGGIR